MELSFPPLQGIKVDRFFIVAATLAIACLVIYGDQPKTRYARIAAQLVLIRTLAAWPAQKSEGPRHLACTEALVRVFLYLQNCRTHT